MEKSSMYIQQRYTVYVQTDGAGCITAVNSSAFVGEDWGTEIDSGLGDKYHHAQGNYLDGPLYTADGIPRYKLADGKAVERTETEIEEDRAARTETEIEADRAALPEPGPTLQTQMQAAVRLARMQAQALPDAQAVTVPELYPAWTEDAAYGGEGQTQIVSRPNSHLYRCQQPHTSQAGWEPENTPAMWVVIAASEAGTADDPIPAARGMEYEYGKYYRDPEDGKTYLCQRTGEAEGGKIVLQYLPHELIGQYFTEV